MIFVSVDRSNDDVTDWGQLSLPVSAPPSEGPGQRDQDPGVGKSGSGEGS